LFVLHKLYDTKEVFVHLIWRGNHPIVLRCPFSVKANTQIFPKRYLWLSKTKIVWDTWHPKVCKGRNEYKAMTKHLETKNDNDIVIFLDGFDTKINKNPGEVVELFRECNCKVLVSKDPDPFYAASLIFGKCSEKSTANSGLYMGYAKELKSVIDEALTEKCEDDQTNINTVCQKSEFVKVDEEEKIFKNFGPLDKKHDSDASFLSTKTESFVTYISYIYKFLRFCCGQVMH
jgi:hypothetical protein